MRKSLLLGLLALTLLVIPGVVSAQPVTNNEIISGTVPSRIEILLSPTTIDYGTMSPDNFVEASTTVTVTAYATTWDVKISDESLSPLKGHMRQFSPYPPYPPYPLPVMLFNSMRVATCSGCDYHNLETNWDDFMDQNGPPSQMAFFNQTVAHDDPAGSYSITATFTGTPH
jgi:hypothetical protein